MRPPGRQVRAPLPLPAGHEHSGNAPLASLGSTGVTGPGLPGSSRPHVHDYVPWSGDRLGRQVSSGRTRPGTLQKGEGRCRVARSETLGGAGRGRKDGPAAPGRTEDLRSRVCTAVIAQDVRSVLRRQDGCLLGGQSAPLSCSQAPKHSGSPLIAAIGSLCDINKENVESSQVTRGGGWWPQDPPWDARPQPRLWGRNRPEGGPGTNGQRLGHRDSVTKPLQSQRHGAWSASGLGNRRPR